MFFDWKDIVKSVASSVLLQPSELEDCSRDIPCATFKKK